MKCRPKESGLLTVGNVAIAINRRQKWTYDFVMAPTGRPNIELSYRNILISHVTETELNRHFNIYKRKG